jgi:predicted anti-sigma-YlaC factor YlaD
MSVFPCQPFHEQLIQYVADGEPALASYALLRAHLAACPACRALARRLRIVENGLRTYPAVSPAPQTTEFIMRAITRENQPRQEEWRLVTWDVWVPALAFALALIVAIMSLPVQSSTSISVRELAGTLIALPSPLDTWLFSLRELMSQNLFWAIWIGIFVTMAGLGVSLSLSHWDEDNSESLDRLETRLSDAATRLWDHGRHVH